MTSVCVGEDLLIRLATAEVQINEETSQSIESALKDFIAGVHSGSKKYPKLTRTGITATANYLALAGSADDLDDVDWDVLTHPGSIIWPVLIAAYREDNSSLEKLIDAAFFGYRAGRSIASLLGVSHRSNWHLTTTSGAVAATSALARYWDLPAEHQIAALKMTLSTMTGPPQAGFERAGATQYNRAVATSLAITAVTAAQVNAPYIHDIWSGPRGVITMFNGEETALIDYDKVMGDRYLLDGISTLHFRTYFATGFASAAVQGLLRLLAENGTPDSAMVTLAASLATTLDGSRGGTWWSPEAIVRSLVAGRDPFNIVGHEQWLGPVEIIFGDVAPGAAKVSATYGDRTVELHVQNAPFRIQDLSADDMELVHEKWRKLSGISDFAEQSTKSLLQNLL